jgi:resuscitation-promoting factor RpfA
MDKSPDAFRTISEVADWLGVPTHVLRFWESRFSQVKPVKRAGGRRYYRPADMALLGGIKRLLHDDGHDDPRRAEDPRRVGGIASRRPSRSPEPPSRRTLSPERPTPDETAAPEEKPPPEPRPPRPFLPDRTRGGRPPSHRAVPEPPPAAAWPPSPEAEPRRTTTRPPSPRRSAAVAAEEPEGLMSPSSFLRRNHGRRPPAPEALPELSPAPSRSGRPLPLPPKRRRTGGPARSLRLAPSRPHRPRPNARPARASRDPRCPGRGRARRRPATPAIPGFAARLRAGRRSAPITPPSPALWPTCAPCAPVSRGWLSPLVPGAFRYEGAASGYGAAWLARPSGGRKVAGSNPASPTITDAHVPEARA